MSARKRSGGAFRFAGVFGAVAVLAAPWVLRAAVQGTRHDLSTSFDPYSDQPCVFCHTPHFANTDVPGPLWNRFVDRNKAFTVYQSATLDTTPGAPSSGVSIVCLGCHDGTLGSAVVNGINGSDKHDLVNAPGPGGIPDMTSYPNCRNCHGEMYGDPPAFWQGTNLSDDHPIAMTYPTPAQDAAFHTPPDLQRGWDDVPLYAGKVECPSCHAVHDPTYTPFLRRSNASSQLCLTCHVK